MIERFWYRIFIDGWYYGINEYRECGIENDLDNDVIVFDHLSKLKSRQIEDATVKNSDGDNRHIVFIIKFLNQSVELICESKDGCMKLKFSA